MNDPLLDFSRFCRLRPVLAAWLTTPVSLTALQRKKLQPALRTSEIDILQAPDTHLGSLLNITVHITGSYSRFHVLACSTHVLASVTFPVVHTACEPHVTGTPSQSISSPPVKCVAFTWWLAEYQPRECLGAARWYCCVMLTPPAARFHVRSSPPWLCFPNTCFLQLLLCVRGQPPTMQGVTGRMSRRDLDAVRRTEMHQGNIILDIHEKLSGLHGSNVGYEHLLPPDAASPLQANPSNPREFTLHHPNNLTALVAHLDPFEGARSHCHMAIQTIPPPERHAFVILSS
jgi:hypothetical protein